MYLSFKKKDSVTSILLFIFNVFLVERDTRSIPLKKVFALLEPFQKSETAIRMGLSRGVQSGLLVNYRKGGEVYYRLTDEAVRGFEYWQSTLARFRERIKLQTSAWDGQWSIVAAAGRDKRLGDDLADRLMPLGYGCLDKDLWVSPYDLNHQVTECSLANGLAKSLYLFRGRLEGNRSPADIVSATWPVEELAQRYDLLAKNLNEALKVLNAQQTDGSGLPFLHFYGLEVFELIQADPQLPLELLPGGWPGLPVTRTFWEAREKIMPAANQFINRVIAS